MLRAGFYSAVTAGFIIAFQHNFKVLGFVLAVAWAIGIAYEVYLDAERTKKDAYRKQTPQINNLHEGVYTMRLESAKFFKEEIRSNKPYMLGTTTVGETERLEAYFQLLEDWETCLADAMGWSDD